MASLDTMDPALSSKIDKILEQAIGVKIPSTHTSQLVERTQVDQSKPTRVHPAPMPEASRSGPGSTTRWSGIVPTLQSRRKTAPQKKVIRPYNLTRFGPIPGIKVGTTWMTRLECSRYGVHAPPLAGIHGCKDEGCYSIVMSGAYEDDVDEGDWFTYIGTGGRTDSHHRGKLCEELPQTFDQTFEHPHNASLLQSYVTRKPVRVVRGHKTVHGPQNGYRYDGLYTVDDAGYEDGKHDYKVCRFTFRRMEGQDPLPN